MKGGNGVASDEEFLIDQSLEGIQRKEVNSIAKPLNRAVVFPNQLTNQGGS